MKKRPVVEAMQSFSWEPGIGPDAAALGRMCDRFPRPRAPMGEAWFMGDVREMFDYLSGDLSTLSIEALQPPLEEIACGIGCFGPLDEWIDWYRYLLPRLVSRSDDVSVWSLLQCLVTGFMTMHPDGVESEPYAGYRDDVMRTLGRCIMDSRSWPLQRDVDAQPNRSIDVRARAWRWWEWGADLSASLFLCLKYLPAKCVPEWFRSVLRIPSPAWRAHLVCWLVDAHDVLRGDPTWPSGFESSRELGWGWSHCVRPDMHGVDRDPARAFIPADNARAALQTVSSEMSPERCLEWLASMDGDDALEAQLVGRWGEFERLYVAQEG